MDIIDKCIFTKCPMKSNCLRFDKKLRKGQVTIFKYNNGCVNYWNKNHALIKQL